MFRGDGVKCLAMIRLGEDTMYCMIMYYVLCTALKLHTVSAEAAEALDEVGGKKKSVPAQLSLSRCNET